MTQDNPPLAPSRRRILSYEQGVCTYRRAHDEEDCVNNSILLFKNLLSNLVLGNHGEHLELLNVLLA